MQSHGHGSGFTGPKRRPPSSPASNTSSHSPSPHHQLRLHRERLVQELAVKVLFGLVGKNDSDTVGVKLRPARATNHLCRGEVAK
jgi:hypothetical protein